MNTPGLTARGRFSGVDYFNGGVFAQPVALDELHMDEQALPLDNLDDNFLATDALIVSDKAADGIGGLNKPSQTKSKTETEPKTQPKTQPKTADTVRGFDPADLFIPAKKKLWTKLDTKPAKRNKPGQGPANKQYELDSRETEHINAALSDQADVASAQVLNCNVDPQAIFQGVTPGHAGFVLSPSERSQLISSYHASSEVIYPYLVGRELLTGDGKPARHIIDFDDRAIFDAQTFTSAFIHVQSHVLPDVQKKADEEPKHIKTRKAHLERWWRHWRDRMEMKSAYTRLDGRFIACSRVTKRPVFVFASTDIRPGDALFTFVFDDDFSFGMLQSDMHWQWFIAKCSKLEARFRYTPESVFDTFPWPQSPSDKDVNAAAAAGRDVRAVRDEALTKLKGGLRALYRTLELPGKNPLKDAHAALDDAVMKCYGFSKKKDLLQQLLDLNLDVAEREARGEAVTAPGIPAGYQGDRAALVTDDCIRP